MPAWVVLCVGPSADSLQPVLATRDLAVTADTTRAVFRLVDRGRVKSALSGVREVSARSLGEVRT